MCSDQIMTFGALAASAARPSQDEAITLCGEVKSLSWDKVRLLGLSWYNIVSRNCSWVTVQMLHVFFLDLKKCQSQKHETR